jgi:hypothetical protein
MDAAIACSPHKSMPPEAFSHFAQEVDEKVALGQAKVILCDDIWDNPPPHKFVSRFCQFN